MQNISDEETAWQDKLVELFNNGKEPPVLDLGEVSAKPGEVQEAFRVKMLEYWASNPNALRYSNPIEPANSGALEVLRYHRGHRDSRGCTVVGQSSILDDLEEIHQERKERKEKAKAAIVKAAKDKQKSILAFVKPRSPAVKFESAQSQVSCWR
eukprot:EG_transcript_37564